MFSLGEASCTMEMVKYAIANGLDLLQPFRPRYLPTDNLFHVKTKKEHRSLTTFLLLSCSYVTQSILLASQSIEV